MTPVPPLLVRRLSPRATLPKRMTAFSAGLDLTACLPEDEPMTLAPMARTCIPTGLQVAIAEGFEGQVRARSGLALRHGLALPNAPGTIDADYRGELQVLVVNLGSEPIVIRHGERIAQLIVAPVALCEVVETEELPPPQAAQMSWRQGGFGSTGV